MFRKCLINLITSVALIICSIGQYHVEAAEEFFKTEHYIEAESGLTRSDIYEISSPYASGGKYLVSNSAKISFPDKIKTEEVSFLFDIDAEGEYKTFMRIYIPASSSNEIYWRWNNGEWQTFSGTANKDFYWAEIGTQRLKTGINKLQFCHKSTGVYYDMIYVSNDSEFYPVNPDGVEKMPDVKATSSNFYQTQSRECTVRADMDGVMFEAENASLQSGISIVRGTGLSGGASVLCSGSVADQSAPLKEEAGWIEFVFSTERTGKYNIWGRTYSVNGASDSCYVAAGPINENPTYRYMAPIVDTTGYVWSAVILSIEAKAGEPIRVRIRPRESNWRIDQFVITDNPAYLPSGIESEIKFKNTIMYPTGGVYPPVNPPAGEHPRLLFRKDDIPEITSNIDHPKNAQMKELFFSYAKGDVSLGTVANNDARFRIEAKALYYALYGDAEIGRQAVELAQEAIGWEMNKRSDGQERAYELIITMHSRVYDWCYDLMTPEQRERVHDICVAYCVQTESGWPPTQASLATHGAESVLLRGMLSFAIATYDERPDYWDCVGGRFYKDYVPERAWHQEAIMHHQGSNYGHYRHQWSCWAAKIITGMGAEAPFDLVKAGQHAYSQFTYARRPDGSRFKWGDWNYTDPMMYHSDGGALLIMHSISKDPYVTDELMRYYTIGDKDGISNQLTDPVTWLLLFDPNIEPMSVTNFPNSRYFGSPVGATFARTGWEEGIDSDSVAAVMFINEWQFGGHQHKDRGSFQLWYKGPLASESGFYDTFGSDHHTIWSYQSTAHNTVLVYDPDEPTSNFGKGINDGGQRGNMVHYPTFEEMLENPDEYKQSMVTGQEIDPENPIKPYYTYLKGDLTNAYSDKVSDYTRSFMFLDLKEREVPAALIVFDKITTPDSKLEKTWLLHGQTRPQISGSRSVWGTLPYEDELGRKYTGKMVVDSLLPADNKIETNVVGGVDEGWSLINGVNYPYTDINESKEDNTYRMEKKISGENTTYFLNCIQVTDEKNKNVYITKLLETDEFYGIEISDRVVMFSKSGRRIGNSFELKGQTTGVTFRYTVCDVEKGQWKITAGNDVQIICATEDGGVLSFETSADVIKAEKIDDSSKETIVVELENAWPITVKMGGATGSYLGFKTAPEIINGKLMVAASGVASALGLKSEQVFLGETFSDEKLGSIVTFKSGSRQFIKNGEATTMINEAYYKNDELMVELRSFAESFGYIVHWDDTYQRAILVENKPVVFENLPGYAKIISLENDDDRTVLETESAQFVGDGVMTTLWAADGIGRYIQIELEKEEFISGVEIVFNPNNKRSAKFEIQLSTDNVNYETVYEGYGWSGTDGLTWESFAFDIGKQNKAKYIRYVGLGSNISNMNGVRELRFKTCDELVTWAEKDSYAKISSVRMDDGEIDGAYKGEYLTDNNSRTIWKVFGKGRYVDFVLEENSWISGVDIVFEPESRRSAKFEIAVSDNGTDFVTVYKGKSDPGADTNSIEHFDFDKVYEAKYVRYIANGSDISQWNGVREIRIINKIERG